MHKLIDLMLINNQKVNKNKFYKKKKKIKNNKNYL